MDCADEPHISYVWPPPLRGTVAVPRFGAGASVTERSRARLYLMHIPADTGRQGKGNCAGAAAWQPQSGGGCPRDGRWQRELGRLAVRLPLAPGPGPGPGAGTRPRGRVGVEGLLFLADTVFWCLTCYQKLSVPPTARYNVSSTA